MCILKVKHLKLWLFECKEPSHDAFILGLAAAGLLAAAHILANLIGGCNYCYCSSEDIQKAPPSRQLSLACLIFTWYVIKNYSSYFTNFITKVKKTLVLV